MISVSTQISTCSRLCALKIPHRIQSMEDTNRLMGMNVLNYSSFYTRIWIVIYPPVLVNQSDKYTLNIHQNITSYWVINCTPSVNTNRIGCNKSMSCFSLICGFLPVNKQVQFFDGHGIYFYNRAMDVIIHHRVHTFFLRTVNISMISLMIIYQTPISRIYITDTNSTGNSITQPSSSTRPILTLPQ